jgi:hypothetical protein
LKRKSGLLCYGTARYLLRTSQEPARHTVPPGMARHGNACRGNFINALTKKR